MTYADLHSLDVLLIHDENLYVINRHSTIGLIDQVININSQIINRNNVFVSDVCIRPQANEISDSKADKSDTQIKTETDTLLDIKTDKIDIIDAYSRSEDDALILLKANVADIVDSYSKIEDDALLLLKADKTQLIDSYSKAEDDALVLLKANVTDIVDCYSKTETDTLHDAKADNTDLTNYVDLTSAQTISGTKQFNIIGVIIILKQNKNDASILLASGGDIIVSSLITQPQLQEVRDIATGKSKAYVFDTQSDLNDCMADQENVAKLVIGDNLYIIDKEDTDYWWDGSDLKMLETELPDVNNIIVTL
ncbi:MAG: hypothetical protein EZS28_000359 [Streblomastix strix]|uniref:Uncharacterized protein n=1 Tax=Streblomastix strix TaxID=222440 RepID=A0A5J4XC31_9EUKA|nr:MAG: hypothetical protein EZS28_000359 [Streblomastix strix]